MIKQTYRVVWLSKIYGDDYVEATSIKEAMRISSENPQQLNWSKAWDECNAIDAELADEEDKE